MFIAEMLFFSFLIDFFPWLAVALLILLYLLAPTFFFQNLSQCFIRSFGPF
jgi:hypothetical protein